MTLGYQEVEEQYPGITAAFTEVIDAIEVNGDEFPIVAGLALPTKKGLELVALETNAVNCNIDSTCHAEMETLRKAQKTLGTKHLPQGVLLGNIEPCEMCVGAAGHTHLSTAVWGADHSDIEGKYALVGDEYKPYRVTPSGYDTEARLKAHGITVVRGFMRDQVLERMQLLTLP